MRRNQILDYIYRHNTDKEDIKKLIQYTNENIDKLNYYKSNYPVISSTGGIYCIYSPSATEYLEFEQECGSIMKMAEKMINRAKYNITEKELIQFYGEDYPGRKKSNSTSNNRYSNKKLNKAINISNSDVELQAELFANLFNTDKECFIRIRCESNNHMYSYNVQDLKDPVKLHNILNARKFTREDLFYSLATYRTMKNCEEDNIFSMHCIECDIDYIDKKIKRFRGKKPIEVFKILQEEEFGRSIPVPNIVEIGRQLKLFFKIESVGATKPSKNLVKRVNKVFSQRLIDFGADSPRLTDGGRINGSINSKSGDKVEIFFIKEAPIYTLKQLREEWLDPLPKWYPAYVEKRNKVVRFIPRDKDIFFSINQARISDFYKIANYFGQDFDGRRFLCFQVRNHAKLSGFTDNKAEKMMKDFNNNLAKPLAWRVIERDTRNVNKKQWLYKDITILDHLGLDKSDVAAIGLQELKYLSDEDKKERKKELDNEYNYKRYRNIDDMTKTEVKRRNEFIQIARLELQGMSLRDISEELGKAVSTLSEKINKVYKKINYNEIKQAVELGIFNDLGIELLA